MNYDVYIQTFLRSLRLIGAQLEYENKTHKSMESPLMPKRWERLILREFKERHVWKKHKDVMSGQICMSARLMMFWPAQAAVCVCECVDKRFYWMACLYPLIPAFISALCHATPVRNNQHNTRGCERSITQEL